jgi:hypothetical protein
MTQLVKVSTIIRAEEEIFRRRKLGRIQNAKILSRQESPF